MDSKGSELTFNGITPTILIISDRPETGALWVYSLQRKSWKVVLESYLEKAIDRAQAEIPDIILIDTQRPDLRVLKLVRDLRTETVVPILMLVYAVPEDMVVDAYFAGVDECILKPIGATLIIAKVRAWMRRSSPITSEGLENIQIKDFSLLVRERTLQYGSRPPIKLTNLELRLLHLLMSLSPRTLGYNEIIQGVWGYASDLDYSALKNVVYRLRQKIEIDPAQPRILLTVTGTGYKFVSG